MNTCSPSFFILVQTFNLLICVGVVLTKGLIFETETYFLFANQTLSIEPYQDKI